MKRSDFLKRLGIGLGAVVVAPRVLAEMPAKEEKTSCEIDMEFNSDVEDAVIGDYLEGEYYVGLFYENKELDYDGYARQKTRCRLSLNGDGNWNLIPNDVTFGATPTKEPRYCNLVKLFDDSGDVLYHIFYGYSLYIGSFGNSTISWPKK